MSDKTWKARERQVAEFFNCERTPLSGGNGKQTRSDTLHPILFIEHKHRQRHAVASLLEETRELAKREGKVPVVTLSEHGKAGFLVVFHCDDLEDVLGAAMG